ncbi:MAG: DUF4190 domain-containing protein [Actinomycetota bacterium]|nr:DUF4190 domain-containing protein [Actinomycetota bacterium]
MNEIKFFECPSCGARITGDKKFCDYCGGKLKVPEEKKKSTEIDSQSSQVKPQEYARTVYIQKEQKTTSGLAVAAFIMSLFNFNIISLIMGIVANSRISKPDSNLTGKGFAIAAIVLSTIQTIFWIIWGITICSVTNYY